MFQAYKQQQRFQKAIRAYSKSETQYVFLFFL